MYDPQSDSLDFEIGSFGSFVKGVGKGALKGLNKITEYTITKPSMMIGKAIGGKKGEAIGKKLGGFTSTVTKLGVGAGALGALAPIAGAIAPVGVPVATAMLAKRALKSKAGKGRKAGKTFMGRKGGMSTKAHFSAKAKAKHSKTPGFVPKSSADNALAAKVAALLVSKLGGPLNEANKALRLADLQRTATYEHKKLMSDSDFRKKVLAGISLAAAGGNADCQRTIRVLVQR